MKTHIFKGRISETIDINRSGQAWQLAQGARISGVDIGFLTADGVDGSRIVVDGRITPAYFGIASFGDGDRITIGRSGVIAKAVGGGGAIYATGDGAHVVNSGRLEATGSDAIGIWLEGGPSTVAINKGEIFANIGMKVTGEARLTNTVEGRIEAGFFGVGLIANGASSTTFVNHGVVLSENESVRGGASRDYVTNTGRMVGDVKLLGGDDVLDNRGGKLKGATYGSIGDDMLITDKAGDRLVEQADQGYDTVRSTVTYTLDAYVERLVLIGKANAAGVGNELANRITGNAGNNTLSGVFGNDSLDGGKGNDRLYGGDDADIFVFRTGGDHDRIADFEQGLDHIDLAAWKGFDDFADVLKHAQDGKHGVVITLGQDSLTISGVIRDELTADDFTF